MNDAVVDHRDVGALVCLLRNIAVKEWTFPLCHVMLKLFLEMDESDFDTIHPDTHFTIWENGTCADWSVIPKPIRQQTTVLQTATILTSKRLEYLLRQFPRITKLVLMTKHIGKFEVAHLATFLSQTATQITEIQYLPYSGVRTAAIPSDELPPLPAHITCYKTSKVIPFAFYASNLVELELVGAMLNTLDEQLVHLKRLRISNCDNLDRIGPDFPCLEDLVVWGSKKLEQIHLSKRVSRLSLSFTRIRDIYCESVRLTTVFMRCVDAPPVFMFSEQSSIQHLHFDSMRLPSDYLTFYLKDCHVEQLHVVSCTEWLSDGWWNVQDLTIENHNLDLTIPADCSIQHLIFKMDVTKIKTFKATITSHQNKCIHIQLKSNVLSYKMGVRQTYIPVEDDVVFKEFGSIPWVRICK